MKLVPGDATAALVVDVARARGSKPWRLAEEEMNGVAGAPGAAPLGDLKARLDELKAATGVDVTKDVDVLVLGAARGGATATPGTPAAGYVMIVQGKNFDEARLADYVSKTSKLPVNKVDVRGVGTYAVTPGATAAVLDPKTLIAGSPDWVKRAIDLAKDGGASAADNVALQGVLARHDPAAALWLGLIITPDAQALIARSPLPTLGTAQNAAVSVVLDPDVRVIADVALPAAADATAAHDALASLIKEYRPLVGTFVPVAGDLLDAVVLEVKETRVVASVTLTDALIADLRAFAKERAAGAGAGALPPGAPPGTGTVPGTAAPVPGTAAPVPGTAAPVPGTAAADTAASAPPP
jgi:hypothetical protein